MIVDWKKIDYSRGRQSYYVDLNAREFRTPARLRALFNFLVNTGEVPLSRKEFNRVSNELENMESVDKIAKKINSTLPDKKLVYFFYGVGDDENDGDARAMKSTPKRQSTKIKEEPKVKKKDTQTALEENLKKQSKASKSKKKR